MGHHEPPQNGFAGSEANGFSPGSSSVHEVVERSEESLCRHGNTATSFVWLQRFANPVKQGCAERLFQLLQLAAELTLPVWIRASGDNDRPRLDHRTQCM